MHSKSVCPSTSLSLGGTVLWLAYGILLGLLAVVFWNGVNCILYVILLSVKLKYGMRSLSSGSANT